MISDNNTFNLKRKILIADDSQLNREMLTDILGDEYEYIYAADGAETMELLQKNAGADILLLDMNMPKISGMQVLKAMRERNWLEEIPVVIISAENDDNFIRNAYYLGATDYIVRPFNAFLVQHRVKNTLTMYQQKKQLVRMVESQVLQREKTNNMLIRIFSHVMELRNSESGSHTLNVQTITNMLLKKLVKLTDRYALSEEDISMISSVSALHDIGKIMIPDNILNKPGRLTSEEREIMKKHTVRGDDFLNDVPINQGEKLMIIAHDICRHHHERYDGNGYPDGLRGDDIPICAQAVSIADVYDALTSERCYKSAFTHEKAKEMILGGECGVFNPLLLQAFKEISDELIVNLNLNSDEYDIANSYLYAGEVFKNQEVLFSERNINIAEIERFKKEFFAERCRGIQFEYDAVLRKIKYIRYYDENGEKVNLHSDVKQLLSNHDCELLAEKIKKTTRMNPYVEVTVPVPINDDLRWHRLVISTIWTDQNAFYVGIIGHFEDIHDRLIAEGKDFLVNDKVITGKAFLAMRDIFDIVRIVDPVNCNVLKFGKDGGVMGNGQKCYNIWNRSEACKNCTSAIALGNKNWMGKLEVKDGFLYSVLSRYVKYGDVDCVLEVAFCIDDSSSKTRNEIGFYPDSIALKNYYKDTLTKTYSRGYLERFMPNFENAKGIAIADIDNFKKINDTYGHIAGDAALKHIAKAIKSCIRKGDVVIRYGGDEFLLIFDDISESDFYDKLAEIKKTVHESEFAAYPQIKHDISIGGAYDVHPFDKAVDTADKAMYKDKFRNKSWEV